LANVRQRLQKNPAFWAIIVMVVKLRPKKVSDSIILRLTTDLAQNRFFQFLKNSTIFNHSNITEFQGIPGQTDKQGAGVCQDRE